MKHAELGTWYLGTWGDGSLGHQHTRLRCIQALEYYADENFASRGKDIPLEGELEEIVAALEGEMSDDAWEESQACEWLNEYAPFTGACWGWLDGDFGLWEDDEDDE